MSFFKRLFRSEPDPKEALRPLWHRTVVLARDPEWFTTRNAQDTLEGRFDVLCAVLSMILLRMERADTLKAPSVHLTELFVEDIDGQLREAGLGDPTLGKKMGQVMSVLGGRLGAYREALSGGGETLETVVARNVDLGDEATGATDFAKGLQALHARLAETSDEAILRGNI